MIRGATLFILLMCAAAWAGQGMGPGPGVKAYSTPSGYSDSFTNTNDTPLATHNSNWTNANGTFVVSNFEITNNTATITGDWAIAGAMHSSSTSDTSQVVVKALTNTSQPINRYVGVRMNGTSLGYNVYLSNFSGGVWGNLGARKDTAGLGVACTGFGISAGADHTMRVVASGTSTVTINVYIDGGGSPACSWTDSSSTITSGHPGFFAVGNGTTGNGSFDNWTDQ